MTDKLNYSDWLDQEYRDLEATTKGIPDALEAYHRFETRKGFLETYGQDMYAAYLADFKLEVRDGVKFFFKPYKGWL